MKKYYEEAKYNAAFDRCVDVMARLLQKVRAAAVGADAGDCEGWLYRVCGIRKATRSCVSGI